MAIEDQEHRFRLPWHPSRLLIGYLQRTRFLMTYNMEISYAGRGQFDVRIIPIYFQQPHVTREIMSKLRYHLLPVFTNRPWNKFAAWMKPREITALIALRALMRQQKQNRLANVKLDDDAMERIYAFARVDPNYKPFNETVRNVRQLVVDQELKDDALRCCDLTWVSLLPPEIINQIVKKVPKRRELENDDERSNNVNLQFFDPVSIKTLLELRAVNRMFAKFVDSLLPTVKSYFETKNKIIFAHNADPPFFMDFTQRTWDDDEQIRTPFDNRSVQLFGKLQCLRVGLVDYMVPKALDFVHELLFDWHLTDLQIDAISWNKFTTEDRELISRFAINAFNSWTQLKSIGVFAEAFNSNLLWQLDWPLDGSRSFTVAQERKYVLSIRL
ncbi:hypothetical protein M3Y98_00790600 [Aphelenchoides besseyi]|nr:hypothetical protein M3Y98_00790600 [Aphelenchoides besseyi]KAI6211927.1 hypothetical protein M3Y96_00486200 [Aphelenchoides besseyi]